MCILFLYDEFIQYGPSFIRSATHDAVDRLGIRAPIVILVEKQDPIAVCNFRAERGLRAFGNFNFICHYRADLLVSMD